MSLFDVIPNNLFSILSSKNKEIYLQALMLLHELFQYNLNILVDDYIAVLSSQIEDFEVFDEDDGEAEPVSTSIQKARFVLNRFIKTGWVDKEFREGSFVEIIALKSYSIKLLRTLYEISRFEVQEYNSLVYSTYKNLKRDKTDDDERMYDAIVSAKNSTNRLLDELKTLYHNIRSFHQQINDLSELNALLKDHFDDYKNLIDRIYHPIKTMDSIYRYKKPIIDILTEILADDDLLTIMSKRAMEVKLYPKEEDAYESIRKDIDFIMDSYNAVPGLIDEIDRKHSLYTKNSIEKMRYLLTADKSFKGTLVKILKHYATSDNKRQEQLIEIFKKNTMLHKQETIDAKSLRHKNVRSKRVITEPLRLSLKDHDMENAAASDMKKIFNNAFSISRVYSYMDKILLERNDVHTKEIGIENEQEFLLLVLATIRSSDNDARYELINDKGNHETNGFSIPNMIFLKRG